MRKALLSGLLVLGLGSAVTGCELTGPKLTDDPNNPTTATTVSLFIAAQTNLWVQSESDLARTACVWVQQCAGRLSQYLSVDNYGAIGDGDFWISNWTATYGGPLAAPLGPGGGLIDLRRIQTASLQAGDSTFTGIAYVMEAWLVGTAADVWGDIPYSEAVNPAITAPHLDPQQQVYAALQAKLDTAIILLGATGPRNVGPKAADLVYLGDAAKWQRMAYTLKARLYIHTAEAVATAYDSVVKYAPLGILPGEDYNNYHTPDLPSSNIWFQFFSTAAANYIAAGATGVDTLQNAGDPRLAEYYSPSPADPSGTIFAGGAPGAGDTLTVGTISSLSATRLAPDFQQPLVTWAEGRLLLAEAAYQTGDEPTALAELTSVRADAGLTTNAGLTGGALLHAIMIEKYTRMFQTIEVWSDYRRTCEPHLTPVTGYTEIPTRLPYPLTERNANPSISSPGPSRNWNDPNPCP